MEDTGGDLWVEGLWKVMPSPCPKCSSYPLSPSWGGHLKQSNEMSPFQGKSTYTATETKTTKIKQDRHKTHKIQT